MAKVLPAEEEKGAKLVQLAQNVNGFRQVQIWTALGLLEKCDGGFFPITGVSVAGGFFMTLPGVGFLKGGPGNC
jgi:hypothetical protein